MTPELKTACELVFQEHKVSGQRIKWNGDAFRGRISIGLSELAKETLVEKNIILLPNKAKKIFTQLNPDVATAGSFEEAEKMIVTKTHSPVTTPTYDADPVKHIPGTMTAGPSPKHRETLPAIEIHATEVATVKWQMTPLFLYVVWPLCGAAAGVLISLLMNFAYTELFSNLK